MHSMIFNVRVYMHVSEEGYVLHMHVWDYTQGNDINSVKGHNLFEAIIGVSGSEPLCCDSNADSVCHHGTARLFCLCFVSTCSMPCRAHASFPRATCMLCVCS